MRLELDNWTGHRFSDLFTLLKVDGDWKIMNKAFHLHPLREYKQDRGDSLKNCRRAATRIRNE